MSRVFVVQEPLMRRAGKTVPRINYETLTPFGEMTFLFTWGELKDGDVFADITPLMKRLRETLDTFTDDDYLVCLGNPALCAMAIAVAMDINNGKARILDWIRNEERYRIVALDLDCDVVA